MMQKQLKIRPPGHILPDNFITGPSFKNLKYKAKRTKGVCIFSVLA